MFSSKQTHKFDYFIYYHLESGWHVTRPNQGLSLRRGKSLGTRLGVYYFSFLFPLTLHFTYVVYIYLLLAECEVSTASYGPSVFHIIINNYPQKWR